jgi:soluble lytic murein transglycosylase
VKFDLRGHRILLLILGLTIVAGISFAPLFSASCRTQLQNPGEGGAIEQLRSMTRNGVAPAESALTKLESDYPNSRVAGLARIVRAQARIKSGDNAGAAALLDVAFIYDKTAIGDYALLLKARALDQAGRKPEARAAYEKLARDYPSSTRAREAAIQDAVILTSTGQAAAVAAILRDLSERNDAAALLLSAQALEQTGDTTKALAAYRRIYFYAPSSTESVEASQAVNRLGSSPSPASPDEALSRADGLFEAKRFKDAAESYADAFSRFPTTSTAKAQARRGIAASNAKLIADAVSALSSVPTSAGETKAEALYYLAQTYAGARQWYQVRAVLDELRRSFPQSGWTPRAFVNAGNIAENAKNDIEASYLFKAAAAAYPGSVEVAQAQFKLAWQAHDAKNFSESSRLLIEHLALYADKNTDNRGRAGYWAGRDSERAGRLKDARAIYEAMQARYSANWYGYLSKERLDQLNRTPRDTGAAPDPAQSTLLQRALANLQSVTVADETAGRAEDERIARADELSIIGTYDWALDELAEAAKAAPASPRVNLAIAGIYRSQNDNVQALNTLRRSYPDYSQMKPEELTREEWDVFYPLAYWSVIKEESRAKNLDPHQVAGLIRQESVFNPRARSSAAAYGLMQLLVPTARLTARRYGVNSTITAESLYEPRLNIRLGTAYLRDQLDKFGRIEYVAAAYNAGPGRVVQWRTSLPLQIDEWAEAIPFKETRGYVQGVVRNTLQYERLYDDEGRFHANVGTRAVRPGASIDRNSGPAMQGTDSSIKRERLSSSQAEE